MSKRKENTKEKEKGIQTLAKTLAYGPTIPIFAPTA